MNRLKTISFAALFALPFATGAMAQAAPASNWAVSPGASATSTTTTTTATSRFTTINGYTVDTAPQAGSSDPAQALYPITNGVDGVSSGGN